MQPEPKKGRLPSRRGKRSRDSPKGDGGAGSPPPETCDLECAFDALSVIESGDPSVVNLISYLGVGDSSSSTSSNCSTSSFDDDDDSNVVHKKNQSDDDDINENYPVDPHKVAAISSAFSSRHLPPKRSKMHRIRTNFNKKLEAQQGAQFLLPLYTSQAEEIYSDPHFLNIKHEDILQALSSANLTCFTKCDNEESIPLPFESPLSSEEKELLSHIKKILSAPDLHSVLQIPPIGSNESSDDKNKRTKTYKNSSNSVSDVGKANKKTKNENVKSETFEHKENDSVGCSIEDIDSFLIRKCCTNKYLADGGECSVNKCHKKWKYVKDGLVKFILIPGQFDFNSSAEDDMIEEINIPQIIFDCDSINTRERFLFRNQLDGMCPGGCGNIKNCKRYCQNYEDSECNMDDDENNLDVLDEHIILMDIKTAWNELKILMFWLYWVSTQGFGDFDEFAIGFQTTCYCCYCFHAKSLAKSEKSKQYADLSTKESNAFHIRCTCRKKKVSGKGRNKLKTRFKSDLQGKESSKCPFCISKEKEQESSEPIESTLEDYLKCINLPVENCCCDSSKSNADLFCEDETTTVFVCHKNEMFPPAYVDLSSGDGLSADEIESKLPLDVVDFYTTSCEKWRIGDQTYLNKASSSNYLCDGCYCDCSKPKFYSLLQIISRITEIIDNLVRLDFPFFIHMMDTFYLSLFCRYNAILLTVFSNGCGFFFFKELTQIARIIRKCGTWLMQILGPKRLRLAYTLFFALPGQHFLNSIYWKWADVPALDHFLKLSVMLSHDIISQEWRNLLVDFLDILPYLYDAAVLSDIDDVFSISRFRQDFDKDVQLSIMYERYALIQKKCLDKSLVWHLKFNKMDEDLTIDYESNVHDAAISRFLKNLTETILKPKKIEIKLLSKFCTNGWYDFEKLLAYSLIKAYAIGHFINNEYLNFWIKKVFCFCIDPDASLKCINKTKLSLQLFIDLMAYHKNVKKLKQNTLNQISMDGHRDKIEILIKAFHSKHFGSSSNKPDKIHLKMDRYIKINEETMKKLEKQFNCNFIWSEAGETSSGDCKNTIKITTAETFKKFNPVTLLVEFFNAVYSKDSILKKREYCACEFHKNLIPEKSVNVFKVANNTSVCVDDTEVSEYAVDIPENFNYDSSDETMNSDDEESFNDLSNPSEYDSSDGEIENIKIPILLSQTNFDSTEDKEKWSLFTAQLLSDHASNVGKGVMMNCNKKTIINEFIERDIKNSQFQNGRFTKTCENTLKRIKRSMKLDNDNLDLDTTVLFENMNTDPIANDKSDDGNEDLLSNMFPDAICNLDRTEKFKTALKDCFVATMKEIKQLYDVYDSKSIDELLKYDHPWDPTIEEVEEGIVKVMRKGITKQEFELDLHIVCFHIITRSMLQELTPLDKEKRKAIKEKKSDKLSRKRKSAGYFVGDYWISLKCQFEKWRFAAIKIYKNLINLHKTTNGNTPSFKDIGCDFFHYYGFIKGCLLVTQLNTIQDSATAATYLMKDKNVSMFHICEGTWLFAVNEIERLEKKMKKSSESSESLSKKKFFEETREAELLAGRGLSKMINKSSKKTVPETSDSANVNNSQSKKDTTIVVRHVGNKSGFQQSVEACIKHFDNSDTDLNEVSTITFIHTSNKTTKLTCEQENKQVSSKTPSKVVKSDVKTPNNPVKSSNTAPSKEIVSDQNKNVDNNTGQSKSKTTNPVQKDTVKEKCTINHESHGKCYTEGKCPLHPDSSRSNHLQTGEHPCNCCYCTVFGQVPPMTGPVSRNFNETRERMRTKLNKKKMSEKGKEEDKTPQITTGETNSKESDKVERKVEITTQSGNTSTNSVKTVPNSNKTSVPVNPNKDSTISSDEPMKTLKPTGEKEIINKLIAKHTKGMNDLVKQGKSKKPISILPNNTDTKVTALSKNSISVVENKTAVNNSTKDNQDLKKASTKTQTKANVQNGPKTNTVSNSPVTKPEISNETSQRCHSCSRMESKKKQTDVPAAQNSDCKNNEDDKNENKAALNKFMTASKVSLDSKSASKTIQNKTGCNSNTHSVKSSDGSFCSSPTCSGWGLSGYEDDRDLNMLVKFIEEPHRAADKEKKQAKKARQKNKKLKMELLKERDELHEDLISMVGETSRLREEVVRLEQGLASACRRLPPTNKYNSLKHANATDAEIDLEEHECALLLKRAAQEASARATEAATLAEQAHSRLRHVESALNLLSSSVNRACVKQQKLGQTEEINKNAKQPIQQNLSSVYNVDQVLYKNSDFYNNSGSNQGMVTIKRVLLPNSEEHGVTITPKGSDQLIYTSQDHSISLNSPTKDCSENKQNGPKKQNLSWESTIAQINSLANAKKKPKAAPSEKKKNDNKKIEVTKSKIKEEISSQKNTTSSTTTNQTSNVKKNKKNSEIEIINEISVEPMLSKKNLKKMRKAALKAELESLAETENNENKFDLESIVKQNQFEDNIKQKKSKNSNKTNDMDNPKTNNKNETKKINQKQEIVEKNQVKAANKSNKTNPTKSDTSEVSNSKGNKGSNENQANSQKGKKSNQLQSKSSTQKVSNQSPQTNNQTTSLQIVNSLTSAVDKIKLNDDTTIELATSKKDSLAESEDMSSGNNKNAPVSSSIMEQLRSGVQFADLRLPPGITLTRVDPAKQHNVSKSNNIPLMTSATPSAYRPTPPAPPPPAVIMVDTTKLHADRESKSQAIPTNSGDPKKTTKSKKSKKKNKKQPHHVQQATGATSVHTSSINISNDQPKMVTLRNPMFHSSLTSSGMTNLQTPGKRMNDIRIPDPIPMPPNASCQATITPTSNGMYTIRNPLMSMVHQQSMMGMNSIETPPNPILLMANQHLNQPTPHTYCSKICDDQSPRNMCDSNNDLKESINNITNRLTNCSLEKCKDEDNSEGQSKLDKKNIFPKFNRNKFSPVPQPLDESRHVNITKDDKTKMVESIEKQTVVTPSPIGAPRYQEHRKSSIDKQNSNCENPIQKPIGTPFSQYNIPDTSKASVESSVNLNHVDIPEPQKLYTPFGPTDADKTFGSILYQPFSREQNNDSIWSSKTDAQCQLPEDKTRLPPYIHRLGTSRVIVDSDNSTFPQLDVNEQSKNWKNCQTKVESHCDPKPLQGSQTSHSSHPYIYQHFLYEANKESLNNSKSWNNGMYPQEHEFYKHYYQYPTGLSPLHHSKLSHSSSSSCVPSDSSSVYDSISNSSSNSPADSTNVVNNTNNVPEYNYMPPHQISILKTSGVYDPTENFVDSNHSVNHEGFNNFSGLKNVAVNENSDKCIFNVWKDSFTQYKDVHGVGGPMANNLENTLKYEGCANSISQNVVGSQRLSNGLIQNENIFAESSSVFAPDQSITNLNELDSSERDIESFKRFDYYFEPPKNKPKISLNVQDIAFQRPSPTKPMYRNN